LIADPEYPNKVASGRLADVIPCTFCMTCFGLGVDRHEDVKCRINAAVGGEQEYSVSPASKKKKVMVVGAGPAGLEAARVGALPRTRSNNLRKGPKIRWAAVAGRFH